MILKSRTVQAGSFISSYWEQMAGGLVVGLAVGTILTLVVTPCALVLPEIFRNFRKRLFKSKKTQIQA
ncbi:MAG: hypothetical protein Ct9H90mP4_03200 [Gammaproteobacteria bacterium]|nr:MAG: hypothetical protein Ct9H90mP4_03200 [Gammaproteobacteria bacterium]